MSTFDHKYFSIRLSDIDLIQNLCWFLY